MILSRKGIGVMLSLALLPGGAGWVRASAPEASATPADVKAFMARRESCDHARGEEPYDKARARQLAQQFAKFCRGTDAELARLKRAHVDQPAVMAVLGRYEAEVE
jgi:hypothetical protein